jgi:hypothetical protein
LGLGLPEEQPTTSSIHLPISAPLGAQVEAQLLMARKPQYAGPWRRIRLEVLQRDNNQCQIKSEGCTQIAQQVDHILPVSMGGDWFDKDNLRAACARCNNNRNIKHFRNSSNHHHSSNLPSDQVVHLEVLVLHQFLILEEEE